MVQAAGHGCAEQANGLFIKPTNSTEINFYTSMSALDSPLTDLMPNFLGTLAETKTNSNESNSTNTSLSTPVLDSSSSEQSCIVLEDLCEAFEDPAVLDIKIGSVLYDSHASEEKKQRMDKVSQATTSGSLHFRIAGMSLIIGGNRIHYGKDFGREATIENVASRISEFFKPLTSEYKEYILELSIGYLQQLEKILNEVKIEMHSSSVLFIYENNMEKLKSKFKHIHSTGNESMKYDMNLQLKNKVQIMDMRIIDFAHSQCAETIDNDCLVGVRNVISAFESISSGTRPRYEINK